MNSKDLISIHDLESGEIFEVLTAAGELKKETDKDKLFLRGRVIGMIFQKPSTRTRVSFEVGIHQLGGYTIFLNTADMQLKRGETIKDTAKALSRYLNGIVIRAYAHDDVIELASCSTIPVINGLTDLLHPCQVICDVFTIMEKKSIGCTRAKAPDLSGLKVVYIGDGNNIANSWMNLASKLGLELVVCSPAGYEPDRDILNRCLEASKKTSAGISVSQTPLEAVRNADVIYTDVWKSMGNVDGRKINKKDFQEFQVNSELLSKAKKDVIVMHCLPAHRGEEITDEVIDGPHSVVFDQAENRLHVQKAIMKLLFK